MFTINNYLKRIVTDHHTVMFIGVMLVIMGLISLSENLFDKVFGLQFQLAYGYIFLGVFNILLAIAFIIMGAMNIEAGIGGNEGTHNAIEERIKILEERIARLEQA